MAGGPDSRLTGHQGCAPAPLRDRAVGGGIMGLPQPDSYPGGDSGVDLIV